MGLSACYARLEAHRTQGATFQTPRKPQMSWDSRKGAKGPAFKEVVPGQRAHLLNLAKGIKDTELLVTTLGPSFCDAAKYKGKEAPRTKLKFSELVTPL